MRSLCILFPLSALALVSACDSTPESGGDSDSPGKGKGELAEGLGELVSDEFDIDGDGESDGPGVDTDGDGEADAVAYDTNDDGIYDALDTDGDGRPDRFTLGDDDIEVEIDEDSSDNRGDGDGSGGLNECESVSESTENKRQPTDIIIAVDQSSSMTVEAGFVQTELDEFAARIIAEGIDARIVLVAERPEGMIEKGSPGESAAECYTGWTGDEGNAKENPICIQEPLAEANCQSNPQVFTSVNCHVDSENALLAILDTYDDWSGVLRADATKNFVVISDDKSEMKAKDFDEGILAKDSELWEGYFFHAIAAFEHDGVDCNGFKADTPTDYATLISQTGGVQGDLCPPAEGGDQDFGPVWDALFDNISANATLSCDWDIPDAPEGETLDPNKINVEYTDSEGKKLLGRVDSEEDCGNAKDAWYYDDPSSPTQVVACPELCDEIRAGEGQSIDILFGCESQGAEMVIPK